MVSACAGALHKGTRPAAELRLGPTCKGSRRDEGLWTIFDQRYWPGDDVEHHLIFALRHEGIDLLILKRVFEAVDPNVVPTYFGEHQQASQAGARGSLTNC